MYKRKIIQLVGVTLLFILAYWIETGVTSPDVNSKLKLKLMKPSGTEEIVIQINQWNYRMSNEGTYFANPAATRSGGYYPRGSGVSAIYAAGLYVGAKKGDTIAVSDVEFATEYSPGKITTVTRGMDGNAGYRGSITYNPDSNYTDLFVNCKADDRNKSIYEVYFIQKDVEDDEYNKWKTVPYLPLTADGKPGLIADGQTYAVFNDVDLVNQNRPVPLHSENPGLGLEVELESFAFAGGGAGNALEHVVFVKISVTNKSTTDWQEAYLGIWSDPDIGNVADKDLVGVDTVAGLGWVYNDPATGDNAPYITAIGLDFFQGPLVSAADVSADLVARFSGNDTRLRYDPVKNKYVVTDNNPGEFTLGATSYVGFRNGTGEDPGHPNAFDDKTRYWYMEGLNELGNPKAGGKYDVYRGIIPADQRIIFGTGPFVLRSGKTQEMWLGIMGGQGTSNDPANPNSAVAKVRVIDAVAQSAFNSGFSKPGTLDNPTLTVTGADNHVILTWDNKAEHTADTYGEENEIKSGTAWGRDYIKYDFQGYRVYKSLTGVSGSFEKLAEYDLFDGISTVLDSSLRSDGSYLVQYKHIGSDSAFRNDYIDRNVRNGTVYYYAVTAFDYQPLYYLAGQLVNEESGELIPRSLETPLQTRTNFKSVVPQRQIAGYSYDGKLQASSQIAGFNEYYLPYGKAIQTRVVDASKIKNRTILVDFFVIDSVAGQPIRGFAPNTLAYRFIDSATNEIIKIDFKDRDDPTTYIDSNRNNRFDIMPNGQIDTLSGDKIYDDRYFSTYIAKRSVMGVESSPYRSYPVVDGIEYKPFQMDLGIVGVYQVTDGATPLTTPISVLNSSSSNGRWRVVVRDVINNTSGYLLSDIERAIRLIDSSYNSNNTDYEIRFSAVGDTGFDRTIGTNHTAIVSMTRQIPVPFSVVNIGGTTNGVNSTADDSNLIIKLINNFAPIVNYWGYDTAGVNFGYANKIIAATRFPTYSNPLPAATGACTRSQVAFTGIVFQAILNNAADSASFRQNPDPWRPSNGTTIRIMSAKPYTATDMFKFSSKAHTAYSKTKAKKDLKSIRVVPNPYYGRASVYQKDAFDKKIKFTRLPGDATIYIFDIAGNLIQKINHNSTSNNDRVSDDPINQRANPPAQATGIEIWDLKNTKGNYVASGMYVALIDVKGVGKTYVKFAVIQEETRTTVAE